MGGEYVDAEASNDDNGLTSSAVVVDGYGTDLAAGWTEAADEDGNAYW